MSTQPETLASCPTCQLPNGQPNPVYLDAYGACLFGCGASVNPDTGFCPTCREHSTNRCTCEDCGTTYYHAWAPERGWERVE